MDKAPHVNLQSTSHYFLEGLNELGIEIPQTAPVPAC